jgi:hypothetical protein
VAGLYCRGLTNELFPVNSLKFVHEAIVETVTQWPSATEAGMNGEDTWGVAERDAPLRVPPPSVVSCVSPVNSAERSLGA